MHVGFVIIIVVFIGEARNCSIAHALLRKARSGNGKRKVGNGRHRSNQLTGLVYYMVTVKCDYYTVYCTYKVCYLASSLHDH